jgi:hypothetical protein
MAALGGGAMPNGKLGDNPVTDIVVHKQEVFGRRIDDLIRRLHAYGYWDNWAGNSYLFDLQERWRRGNWNATAWSSTWNKN